MVSFATFLLAVRLCGKEPPVLIARWKKFDHANGLGPESESTFSISEAVKVS